MKQQEKQIEEKAKDLKELAKIIRTILEDRTDIKYIPDLDFPIAKEVLKHYQPKLAENSVVLSIEEYENLKHYEDEMYRLQGVVDTLTNEGWDILDEKEEKIRKAERKETAENYKTAMMLSIQEMQKYLEITEEQAKILYHHNAEIAKQFYVEIKE